MESKKQYELAENLMPGGVSSPVRAVKPYPFFVEAGKGPKIQDVEGNEYIDYCLGYGPLILGHRPGSVMDAVEEQLEKGLHFGIPCEAEVELAEKVVSNVPSADMVRFVNSGTEATMNSIRLARAYTGREKVLMFDGCYHGSHDHLLFDREGAKTPGIPECLEDSTIVAPFNNIEAVEEIASKEKLAAIIVEPVVGNCGCIPPKEGFLENLRNICDRNNSLLIFDEVITGFRLSIGGAQEYYGVRPDLTTLGKVIGGGLPIGAFSGRRDIMQKVEPEGDVYHAGTFSGHPLAMVSGVATIDKLEENDVIERTTSHAEEIAVTLRETSGLTVNQVGPMLQVFFTSEGVRNAEEFPANNEERFREFWEELLKRGVFIAPAGTESWFFSYAHTDKDLEMTKTAIKEAFEEVGVR
ncbi:hypothetical protein AKJ57_03755 [candidate division MSBL1 archaeon SCGC-AAA259A05]|uniref:Glutamate-1-semialdehyde 2,1-aminomutase n=1 Tax=candidate division MSBL1 archaeon SCGC-AAA259A05 TaxID=1698259 RepID=A0A133U9C0_9EURY|nr:hypothetical protein AKJ57_03755 [candidate division MSBL1 archaeon SCGC-AAA259A05]